SRAETASGPRCFSSWKSGDGARSGHSGQGRSGCQGRACGDAASPGAGASEADEPTGARVVAQAFQVVDVTDPIGDGGVVAPGFGEQVDRLPGPPAPGGEPGAPQGEQRFARQPEGRLLGRPRRLVEAVVLVKGQDEGVSQLRARRILPQEEPELARGVTVGPVL